MLQSLLFYLWALCSVSKMFSRMETLLFLPLFFSFLACSLLGSIYFYWLWIICCPLLVMGGTVCLWRMCHPCAVRLGEDGAYCSCLSPVLLIPESTPWACGRLPCASDSSIMWPGCSFSNQSLADGHLGHFQSFAITSVAMNNNVHLSFHVFNQYDALGG